MSRASAPAGPSRRARDSPASSSAPEDAPPDAIAARCLERKTRARVVLHADVRGLTFVDDASLLVLSHSAFNEMTSWSSPRPDAFAVKCFGADGKLAERAFEVLGPRGVDGGVVRDFLESMVRLYVSRPTLVREMRSRAVAMTIGVTAPTRALEIAGVFDDDDDGGGGGRELEALEAGMRGVRFESSSATAAAANARGVASRILDDASPSPASSRGVLFGDDDGPGAAYDVARRREMYRRRAWAHEEHSSKNWMPLGCVLYTGPHTTAFAW